MPYLIDNKVDLLCVQETWLRQCDGAYIKEIKEYGFEVFLHRKRQSLNFGGGVAIIFLKNLKVSKVKTDNYASFDHVVCKVFTSTGPVTLINIYRPDYSEKHRFTVNHFIDDFTLLLEAFAGNVCPVILVGDLNIHVELGTL